jgi:GDP-fucose transporter C1
MALERDNRESLIQKYIKIFLVVSGYWIVSILTVFINKTLLSEIDLNAPMFIALYQTLITALICFMKKGLAKVFPKHFSFPDTNVWNVKTMKTVSTYLAC